VFRLDSTYNLVLFGSFLLFLAVVTVGITLLFKRSERCSEIEGDFDQLYPADLDDVEDQLSPMAAFMPAVSTSPHH